MRRGCLLGLLWNVKIGSIIKSLLDCVQQIGVVDGFSLVPLQSLC